jgi:uncharacterized protein YjeT (DUF2065 family)
MGLFAVAAGVLMAWLTFAAALVLVVQGRFAAADRAIGITGEGEGAQ